MPNNKQQQMWEHYHHRFGLAGEGQADTIQRRLESRRGRVLNIGCGPWGDKINNLAKHCALLVCADESPGCLAIAARGVTEPTVRLLAADVHELPFQDGCFDHVLALGLFAYVRDPTRVMAELRRICCLGGSVMLTNAVRHHREPLLESAAAAAFGVVDDIEGYCPAASGDVKRRYLLVFTARNR
jgi:ubiquinone/menaquinone biosynthesis C-methylase UbiE